MLCEAKERQLREDYENRLRDKDSEIRRLRAELGSRGVKTEPVTEKAVATFHRKMDAILDPTPFGGQLDWQGELSELLKEEVKDNGISE